MDKPTLLNMLQTNRALFDELVAQISEERMLGPLEDDFRSGKDILAHTTAWEQRLIQWLKAAAQGEIPQVPEPDATWDDMDRLNAQTLIRNQNRLLQEVMDESRRSFEQLLEEVESFSEEDLIDLHRFNWLDEELEGEPLWRAIAAGPGLAHYQDHFYDLLQRIDPAARFVPGIAQMVPYAGTYASPRQMSLTFRIANGSLMLSTSWPGYEQEMSGLALDSERFTYENFGLITFHKAADGTFPKVEWWTHIFTRSEPEE